MSEDPKGRRVTSEPMRDRFAAGFPLFVTGAILLAGSIYLYWNNAVTNIGAAASAHLELWVLFLALGITAVSAGTIITLAPDIEEELASPASPPVTMAPPAEAPAPTEEWDESALEAHPNAFVPRWYSSDNEDLLQGEVAKPEPPDSVLKTLDELEVSLRRKAAPGSTSSTKS